MACGTCETTWRDVELRALREYTINMAKKMSGAYKLSSVLRGESAVTYVFSVRDGRNDLRVMVPLEESERVDHFSGEPLDDFLSKLCSEDSGVFIHVQKLGGTKCLEERSSTLG